ncbi:MAG: hypothetical protein F9K16_07050 [Thermoanaerobaculia bacterium]|nr:MAG: hypothetical protein F9K16_07050 [Thermoanaerobaculia bacterium]MBZ0101418.1 hypothetical protein [Thermoanaerobaculia bacterium]
MTTQIRKRMLRLALLMPLIWNPSSSAAAENLSVRASCEVPESRRDRPLVAIDANTGRIRSIDSVHFPLGTQVEVVVFNKNPFLYLYEYEVVSRDLEADIIRDGLKLAGVQEPSTTEHGQPVIQLRAMSSDRACKKFAGTAWEEPCQRLEAANRLADRIREIKSAVGAHSAFLELADKQPRNSSECNALRNSAQVAASETPVLIELRSDGGSNLRRLQNAVATSLDAFPGAIASLESPECSADPKCKEPATLLVRRAIAVRTTLERAEEVLDQAASLPDPAVDRELILQVLGNEVAFVETFSLPRREDPTGYTVKILRKQRESGKSMPELTAGEILVGTSRFTISGGIGVSFAESRTFGRQSSLGPDGSLVPVFAVTEESDSRVAGVFQLNGCLVRCDESRARINWSLGAGVGAGEKAADLSLFTGPSFGFIDGKWLLTLAYHQREIQKLNGFVVGDPIPEGLQDPLPTRTETVGALLVTVTYKVR